MTSKLLSVAMNAIQLAAESVGQDRRQWIHICTKGRLDTRDGRGPFFLKDPSKVIEECRARQGTAKMLVDYDHQSIFGMGTPALAAGWIEGLQERKNGIWALVEWTQKAANHIAAGEYKYLSPVILTGLDKEVFSIQNVALTNSPNLHNLTALMRMENVNMTPRELEKTFGSDTTDFSDTEMNQVRQLLKLPPNANPAAVIEAIRLLVAKPQSTVPDPSQYVRIGDFEKAVAEANSLRQGIDKAQAMSYVDEQIRGGRIVPAFREWGVNLCTVNKPAFDQFLAKTSPALSKLFTDIVPNTFDQANRDSQLSEAETEICERMGLTPEQFKAAR